MFFLLLSYITADLLLPHLYHDGAEYPGQNKANLVILVGWDKPQKVQGYLLSPEGNKTTSTRPQSWTPKS